MTKFNKYFSSIIIILSTLRTGCSQESTQKTKRRPLHEAAAVGDCVRVARLLNHGFKVQARDAKKETAMHVAAKNGHYAVVKLLVDKKAGINVRGQNDQTPLHYACQQGNADTVRLLISHNAYLGMLDKVGRTPLHYAAANGNVSCVEHLLNRSTKRMNQQAYGIRNTPLHEACMRDHTAVAKLLLERNAKKDIRNRNGCTPLFYAATNGRVALCEMLCQGSDINDSLRTLCMSSCEIIIRTQCMSSREITFKDLIENLLNKGADISKIDEHHRTSLHVAVQARNLTAVKLLVSAGADVNARDKNQWTPLHFAAYVGHSIVVSYLLKQNAETDLRDNRGVTPLSYVLQTVSSNWQAVTLIHNTQRKTLMKLVVQANQAPSGMSVFPHIRTLYAFVSYGVYIDKNEQKWLDANLPEYKKWIQSTKKWLDTVLAETCIETVPRDIKELLLTFVLSQTEPKRTREHASSETEQHNKKQRT